MVNIILKYIECSIPKGKLYYINDQNEFFSIKGQSYMFKQWGKDSKRTLKNTELEQINQLDWIMTESMFNVLLNNQIIPVKQLPNEVILSIINWNTIFAKQIEK